LGTTIESRTDRHYSVTMGRRRTLCCRV
jgi:hypothetical protein